MDQKEELNKLEISEFTYTPIKPEPKKQRTIEVNAKPGWYTTTLKSTANTLKAIRSRISFGKSKEDAKDGSKAYKDLLVKTAICVCIALALLLVKNINSPFTNGLSRDIKTAINSQTDLEKEIGRLKFVENIFGSEPVLSEITGAGDIYPVEGKVTKRFGEDSNRGVSIETVLSSPVLSATSGRVKTIGKTKTGIPYLTITVDDKTEFTYTGVIARVKENAKVLKGEILGTLKGNILTLEVLKDGHAVDPLSYIGENGMQKE